MSKRGLGKGLGALLPPTYSTEAEGIEQKELRVDEILPNTAQPRRQFAEDKLDELALSIKEHGIVQPIIVRTLDNGLYQIVAGERRWRAAQQLGLETVPTIIKDYDEKEVLEIALIENIQREDLNPLEEARAYQILIDEHGLTQEKLGIRIGKSRSYIANSIRLLSLAPAVQELLEEGKISAGHGRALLPLPNKGQISLSKKIYEENLSVRETERIVKGILTLAQKKEIEKKEEDQVSFQEQSFILDFQDRLRERLGTKVEINHQGDKGKIVIEYYSQGDLQRVFDLFFED